MQQQRLRRVDRPFESYNTRGINLCSCAQIYDLR